MRWFAMSLLLAMAAAANSAAESPATAEYLRCEYRVDPLGIDVTQPRLSWEMHDERRGAAQTAYQILVASTPEKLAADQGDLWDSGKVASNQSAQVVYSGKPLLSRMQCHWKVRLWDADGKPSPRYSQPALWTMGLLKPEDVKAKWIGVQGSMIHPGKGPPITFEGCKWIWSTWDGLPIRPTSKPAPSARVTAPKGTRYFRGWVTVPKDRVIREARLLITADDSFQLFVNGKPAGAGTAWNQPQVAEITNHLTPGKNLLAVAATNASESPAGLVGKLVVTLDQGEPIVARIDDSWKVSAKAGRNWNQPAMDDSAWPAAVVIGSMGDKPWGKIEAKDMEVLGCPLFRKDFTVGKPMRRATLYGSALGNYHFAINGQPVRGGLFNPGWTDYRKRVYYNTYDVTDLIHRDGPNAIGAVLAAGWYAGAIGWKSDRFIYGRDPRLFVQLELEAEDGSIQTIATDGSWKTAWGPFIEGEFLAGETYDARKKLPEWSAPGFDDSAWKPVAVTDRIEAHLRSFPAEPVWMTAHFRPVGITEYRPSVFVFDMGQNFAGGVFLKAKGPAGTKIVLRYAEMLNHDGSIYTTNLRGARATDTYILRGEPDEIWTAAFTFHGFRYVEMTGYPGKPTKDTLTGIAINSITPMVGSFECSSPMVNKLYQNICWTQRANFISIPTDCPQRDERLGWTGDAEVFCRAATYNADVASFFTKWLVDLEDAQQPDGGVTDVAPFVLGLGHGTAAWADAGTICPATIAWVYNDRRLLEKHYGMMVRLVEYDRKHSKKLLRPAEGYGDWLSIKADTPKDVLGTAFFAESTHLTAEAARWLGKEEDARKYEALWQDIKAAFNKAYVAPDGRIKGNTQTCYVMALCFNLLPDDKRPLAAKYLVDDIAARGYHLSTGFIGTSMLMPVLAQTGHQDVAYRLLLSDTFPSWGYSIKHGATSIWERWDGWTAEKGFQDPGMNSFAHYSFGAVARWMFQSVAGIDTDGPGFQRLLIKPQPAGRTDFQSVAPGRTDFQSVTPGKATSKSAPQDPGLTWVKASYRSLHGVISTDWKIDGGKFLLNVTIPANTTATVSLPGAGPEHVREGDRPAGKSPGVKYLRTEAGRVLYNVPAGTYRFVVE